MKEFCREDRGKMAVTQVIFGFLLLFLVGWMSCLSVHDPRLSPGHLQPLGTGRPKSPIESTVDYPSPQGEWHAKVFHRRLTAFLYAERIITI